MIDKSEKIPISFINIKNLKIQSGFITLYEHGSKYELGFTCGILFTSEIVKDIKIESHDYFQSLINLRIELEKQNYYLLCNGARRDVNCSGMSREAFCGLYAHLMELGKYIDLDDEVYIFDYAGPDLVCSVKEQEEFNKLHRSSLPEIIYCYAELTEPIFSSTKENIINQLCSHSDWKLVQRKENRLSFKFSDNPNKSQWNIEVNFNNGVINLLFTTEHSEKQEVFLSFLHKELSSSGIICNFEKD